VEFSEEAGGTPRVLLFDLGEVLVDNAGPSELVRHMAEPCSEAMIRDRWISSIEAIAAGRRIRRLARLKKLYGSGRWRKMTLLSHIRLTSARLVTRRERRAYEEANLGLLLVVARHGASG
jgi:hypothetical protein